MNGPRIEYLRTLLSYDPDTGKFRSLLTGQEKYSRFNKRTGYLEIAVGDHVVSTAHRLAWALSYGYWPVRLDHRDRDRTNNRLGNLRLASTNQNAQNRATSSRYISKCIYYDKTHPSRKKYRVRVQADGKRHHIGWYASETEAKEAAIGAINRLHGSFAAPEPPPR